MCNMSTYHLSVFEFHWNSLNSLTAHNAHLNANKTKWFQLNSHFHGLVFVAYKFNKINNKYNQVQFLGFINGCDPSRGLGGLKRSCSTKGVFHPLSPVHVC